MRSALTMWCVVLAMLAGAPLALAPLTLTWAEAQTAPGPAVPPPTTAVPPAEGGPAEVLAFVMVLTVLVIVGVTARILDLKSKREIDAIHLQAQLADALLCDPMLSRLNVTPMVRVPIWRGTPATIKMRGEVPRPELREAVLRFMIRETSRLRSDFRIEDRLAIAPSTGYRAA